MYFLRRLRPIEVAGERVRLLRVSLNAPVLSTPDLPVGPARAVIVTHMEARGRADVTVGVRALRSGEIVFWSFDGELSSSDDLSVASDAALTFAESLGFLFDEEALGPGSQAGKAWAAWIGGDAPALSVPDEAELEEAEVLLEEVLPEPPAAPAAPSVPAPKLPAPKPGKAKPAPALPKAPPRAAAPAEEPAAPRAPLLSKFRERGGSPAAKTRRRQPIARIPLQKRRSPEEEHKLLLRKILSSF